MRYDTPAQNLLKTAGARRSITDTSRVDQRLRNYPKIPQRLGLPADEVRRLVNPEPLTAATYINTFHRGEAPVWAQSRYCPRCLTGDDPHWPDHWQSPLSLICLTHRCYLLRRCPGCLQPPQGNTRLAVPTGRAAPLPDAPSASGRRRDTAAPAAV